MAAGALRVTDQKPIQIPLYGGRVVGRVVTELEPPDGDGVAQIVTHVRNDTQREAERLFSLNRISHDQLIAANMLRDDYEVGHKRIKAASWVPPVDGSYDAVLDFGMQAGAAEEYRLAMNQLSRDHRRIVQDVIRDDMRLEVWARRWRCHGEGLLQAALDGLARHYERSGR
jgi:hypothetical protein